MYKFAILNLSCLLESVVLWRHLVAIKRQGDIRLTFVADNRPMALLSNPRIVETSTPSLLAISICFNFFLFTQHKCPQTLSFCEAHHVESNDFPFLVLFFINELFCSFLKHKTVHLFLWKRPSRKTIQANQILEQHFKMIQMKPLRFIRTRLYVKRGHFFGRDEHS